MWSFIGSKEAAIPGQDKSPTHFFSAIHPCHSLPIQSCSSFFFSMQDTCASKTCNWKTYVSRLISRKTLETFFVVGSRSPRRLRCECFTIVCDSQSHASFSECRPGVHEPDEHPDEARLTQRDRKDAALKESSSQSTVMG